MEWIIKFFELLNNCSPLRASTYLFFSFIIIYMFLHGLFLTINNLIITIKGQPKEDDKD
jgi:hypothetical protein